jgi:hypothetical protein
MLILTFDPFDFTILQPVAVAPLKGRLSLFVMMMLLPWWTPPTGDNKL